MRGFPLLNLLLTLLVLAGAVYPAMRRVTGRLDDPPPPAGETSSSSGESRTDSPEAAGTVPALLSLRLAHPAAEFEVKAGERTLWLEKAEPPSAERQATLELPWEENGVEFTLRVRWPEDTPDTVAEVSVAPDGLETLRQNVWSAGEAEVEEVLRFTWPKGDTP